MQSNENPFQPLTPPPHIAYQALEKISSSRLFKHYRIENTRNHDLQGHGMTGMNALCLMGVFQQHVTAPAARPDMPANNPGQLTKIKVWNIVNRV